MFHHPVGPELGIAAIDIGNRARVIRTQPLILKQVHGFLILLVRVVGDLMDFDRAFAVPACLLRPGREEVAQPHGHTIGEQVGEAEEQHQRDGVGFTVAPCPQ